MDKQPTLHVEIRASLPPVVQAYLAYEGIAFRAKVFAAWHRVQDGMTDWGGPQAEIKVICKEFRIFLERGRREVPSWQVQGLSADLLKFEAALWTFARVEGVEPTNNAAERALRPALLWRKGCFGAGPRGYPTEGNQFVARILTVATTCRQQQRCLLTDLNDAVVAHHLGQSAPVLLTGRSMHRPALDSLL